MAGVFKAYDIRGTYPDQIDELLARKIGYAIAKFLGAKRLVVGRDMRVSGPSIASAAVDGFEPTSTSTKAASPPASRIAPATR